MQRLSLDVEDSSALESKDEISAESKSTEDAESEEEIEEGTDENNIGSKEEKEIVPEKFGNLRVDNF